MTANIQTVHGLKTVEVLKQPFEVNGIRLFVHSDMGGYSVIEWETGIRFTSAEDEEDIRPAINNVFEKIPIERINYIIQENVKKHGLANDPPN